MTLNYDINEKFFQTFLQKRKKGWRHSQFKNNSFSITSLVLFTCSTISFILCIFTMWHAYNKNIVQIEFLNEVTREIRSNKTNIAQNISAIQNSLNIANPE